MLHPWFIRNWGEFKQPICTFTASKCSSKSSFPCQQHARIWEISSPSLKLGAEWHLYLLGQYENEAGLRRSSNKVKYGKKLMHFLLWRLLPWLTIFSKTYNFFLKSLTPVALPDWHWQFCHFKISALKCRHLTWHLSKIIVNHQKFEMPGTELSITRNLKCLVQSTDRQPIRFSKNCQKVWQLTKSTLWKLSLTYRFCHNEYQRFGKLPDYRVALWESIPTISFWNPK